MADTSQPGSKSEQGVFSITRSIEINAPRQVVWDVLLDFQSYYEWNPFVRSQELTDASYTPLPDPPQVAPGAHLLMKVKIPAFPLDQLSASSSSEPSKRLEGEKLTTAKELVTHVDAEEFKIAWRQTLLPGFLMNGERWQTLTTTGPGEEEGGKERTVYTTTETFGGPLAYVLKALMKGDLELSFEGMAEGLKRRAEGMAESAGVRVEAAA